MDERGRERLLQGELARRELARRRYGDYLELVYGEAWIPTRFSRFLAEALQRFWQEDTGHAYDILVLETPPQHGKSWTLTEALPSWVLGKDPDTRVILASYNDESAERFARRNREKLRMWGPTLFNVTLGGVNRATEFEIAAGPYEPDRPRRGGEFCEEADGGEDIEPYDGGDERFYEEDGGPDTVPDDDTDDSPGGVRGGGAAVRPAGTLYRGRLISRGIFAGVTGHPADLLIIDDPIKNREEADSPVYRQKLWAEWVNSLKTRLAAGAKVILVMTPWHEDDLAARILRTEEAVRLLRFPVEAEDEDDPLGRRPGEPLCPELGKDERWLAQFKKSYCGDPLGGRRAWLALYLCRPRTEQGNLVRRDWWRFYDEAPECPVQVVSVDAAFKGEERNDFVAITVWGKRGEDYFLLDCRNRHLDFVGTLAAIREVRRDFPKARAVLVEDKANGSAVINVLQRELFCIPVEPRGGKTARVHAVSPAVESGHVYLPRRAVWLEEYLDQWTAFPAGAHDDMVDASTQALHHLFGLSGLSESVPEAETVTNEELYDVY